MIRQLKRLEGMDAVLVTRWTWHGRGRRRQPDPPQRFLHAAANAWLEDEGQLEHGVWRGGCVR
jgi:hypothetical protein